MTVRISNCSQLDRTIVMLVNKEPACSWEDSYYGYFGGGGSGWFVEENTSSISEELYEALDRFHINLGEPYVPRPEELRVELDNIWRSVYLRAGKEEDEEFDYWVIDEAFVLEPFFGGARLAESPDAEFELREKSVLHITQAEFDSLLEAYFKLHGTYPDS